MRWLAPEIIKLPPNATGMESKPADIFAFAMLVIEVFTGKLPFEGQSSSGAANRIFRGDRPPFPQNAENVGFTVQMWELLQGCWDSNPAERPTIGGVVTTWESLLRNDEHEQTASNDQNHGALIPDADDSPTEPRPTSPLLEDKGQRPSKHPCPPSTLLAH